MLLTDDEIKSKYTELSWFRSDSVAHEDAIEFARAIESAILAKLASAELPEPAMRTHGAIDTTEKHWFTADQLRQAFAQGAASQLQTLQVENEQYKDLLELSAKRNLALLAEQEALAAKLANLEADAERLDWLEQNLFNRENVDWVTGKVSKTHNMWVTFAPVGVQGSARRIIDAAKGGQQ